NTSSCVHEESEGSASSSASTDLRRYQRHWTPVHLDFHVDTLTPIVDGIMEAGGQVERLLLTEGPRPVAFCADPFGNGFCVVARVARASGAALPQPDDPSPWSG